MKEYKKKLKKFEAIGTAEEFKVLKDRHEPRRVVYQGAHEKCPTCGSFHVFGKYCSECGQRINNLRRIDIYVKC